MVVGGQGRPRPVIDRALIDEKLERLEAPRRMTVIYRELMHANEPVHEWPVP
jgi:hypothetical protein